MKSKARFAIAMTLGLLLIAAGVPIRSQSVEQAVRNRNGETLRRSKVRTDEPGPVEVARLSEEISVKATGRGEPFLDLSNGRELFARYDGGGAYAARLERGEGEPKALVSGDFDEDGTADLVTSYATRAGGLITLHRGNAEALNPKTVDAKLGRTEGTTGGGPFLSPAKIFSLPAVPDLVAAGDFNADGHIDVIAAQQGSRSVTFMRGDGSGALQAAATLALPGAITALISGDTNRADGLTDLVVAVQAEQSAKLVVFEGPEGAIDSKPEEIGLPAAASALAIGDLNGDAKRDIAVAAGYELMIVHGRDRKISLDALAQAEVGPATFSRRVMPARLTSLAIGDFTGDAHADLGAACADGSVYVVHEEAKVEGQRAARKRDELRLQTLTLKTGASRAKLVCANFSGLNHETLLMADADNQQLHVWLDDEERRERGDLSLRSRRGEREEPVALEVAGEPVAVLPMRLNADGLSDLVILRRGYTSPIIVNSTFETWTVCSATDCGTNQCDSLRDIINRINNFGASSNVVAFKDQIFEGVPTIALGSSLPAIRVSITFDGNLSSTTCTNPDDFNPDLAGTVERQDVTPQTLITVQITGTPSTDVFTVRNSGCIVRDMALNRVRDAIILTTTLAGGATNNSQVEGNRIGTNADGTGVLANSGRGVVINNVGNNFVGSSLSNLNLIAGSTVGVDITGANAIGNNVRFNDIGVNGQTGQALGAIGTGIRVLNGQGNFIGVSLPVGNFSNFIYGSQTDGILLSSAGGNLLHANRVQNSANDGIEINSSGSNSVGGASQTVINFLWNNGSDGVDINGFSSSNNLVQANYIGVASSGGQVISMANNGHGVLISNNASNNMIGGTTPVTGNYIAFNLQDGVSVVSGTGNSIRSNRFFNNGGLGIDLGNDGPDTNDNGDGDSGPNNRQNYPIITSATVPGSVETAATGDIVPQAIATLMVTVNSNAGASLTLQFWHCSDPCDASGRQFQGCIPNKLIPVGLTADPVVIANGGPQNFSYQFDLPNNATSGFMNATATNNATLDTSEISPCAQVTTGGGGGCAGGGTDNSQFISQDLREGPNNPGGTPVTNLRVIAGRGYTHNIRYLNNGSSSWQVQNGHNIGTQNFAGNTFWGRSSIEVGNCVPPNTEPNPPFGINIIAPAVSGRTYPLQWQLFRNGVPFGAATANLTLTVDPDPNDRDNDAIPNALDPSPDQKLNDVLGNNTLFVNQMYRDFLYRERGAGETFWITELNNGVTRAQVVARFFEAEEFYRNKAVIIKLYQACFNRLPDYEGIRFWLEQAAPPNNQTGVQIANQFIGSDEFRRRWGTLDNNGFVNRIFLNALNRQPTQNEINFYVGQLNGGTSRGAVVVDLTSPSSALYQEFDLRLTVQVQIIEMYIVMLLRVPTQQEFTNWVNGLWLGVNPGDEGQKRQRRNDMANAIMNGSDPNVIIPYTYRNRFYTN